MRKARRQNGEEEEEAWQEALLFLLYSTNCTMYKMRKRQQQGLSPSFTPFPSVLSTTETEKKKIRRCSPPAEKSFHPFPLFFLLRLKIYRLSFFSFRSQSKRKGGPRATRQGSKGARRVGEGRENKAKRNLHCQGLSVWLPSVCAPRKRRRRRKEKGGSTHVRANERRASLPATSSSSFLPIFENRTFFSRKKRKKGWRWRGGGRLGGGGGGEGA